jgi:hypothetical protein
VAPRIIIDRSHFPVIVQTMCAGYNREDFQHMFREYELLLQGGRRYAIVVHFPLDVELMRAAERKLVAEWWLPRKEQVSRMNVITVTVLESALLRGAYTALLWIVQPPNPQRVAASVPEAVDMCAKALQEEGEPLTPALEALRSQYEREKAGSGRR